MLFASNRILVSMLNLNILSVFELLFQNIRIFVNRCFYECYLLFENF